MKRWLVLITVALMLACLCACNAAETVSSQPDTEDAYRAHQTLTAAQAPYDADSALRLSLPEVGLDNLFVRAVSADEPLDGDAYGQVYLLGDDRYGGGQMPADHYLVIRSGDALIVEDLTKWKDQACYGGSVELCDVDGDGDKEIVLQECVAMSGGAGQYLSRVLDFFEGKITELFSSYAASDDYDTGFSITILPDKAFRIQNRDTGYSEDFRLTDRTDAYYDSYWYDDNGVPRDLDILVDSFYEFLPVDTDADGVFEIACRQYVSLIGHTDGIGSAQTILRYNGDTASFEIADAWFSLEY